MAGIDEKLAAIEAAARQQTGDEESTDMIDTRLDPGQLKEMTLKELKALATDMGLEFDKSVKKDGLITLIAAEPVQITAETIEEGEDTQDVAQENQEAAVAQEPADVEMVQGRVLVTYTGMVNLRDGDLNVVGHAIQGQVFPATAKKTDATGTWYMIEDQTGKPFLISANVVRFMN